VQSAGAGTYTVANVQGDLGTDRYAAWGLVVVVHDQSEPPRNLTVFDGFTFVQSGSTTPVDIVVSGFKTPPAGPVNARVGVIAYEGELGFTGDAMQLASPPPTFTTLSDALNPADNVFNSVISRLGVRVTTKNPNYVNQLGFDAKIVAANGLIPNSATGTTARLTTKGDTYYPGVVTTAIDLFAPLVSGNKTMTDLNGSVERPGDIVQIDITGSNTGQDRAANFVRADTIPANTTYVPNSLLVVNGINAGPKTDQPGDDTAEFDAANNRVVFRGGVGANATMGGTLTPVGQPGNGGSAQFKIRVNDGVPGGTVITNSATTTFTGQTLGTAFSTTTALVSLIVAHPDLRVVENHVGTFHVGSIGVYTLTVSNQSTAGPTNGPSRSPTPCRAGSYRNCRRHQLELRVRWPDHDLHLNGTDTRTTRHDAAEHHLESGPDTARDSGGQHGRGQHAVRAEHDRQYVGRPDERRARDRRPGDHQERHPQPYVAGAPFTYTIVVSNNGPDGTFGQVQDTIPAFLTGATWTCTAGGNGGSCVTAGGTGDINAFVNLPDQATVTFTLTGTVAAGTTGPISNTATVAAPPGVDPFPANNSSSEIDGATQNADLRLTKTNSPAQPVAGQPLMYMLVATNVGPDPGPLARLQEPLIGPSAPSPGHAQAPVAAPAAWAAGVAASIYRSGCPLVVRCHWHLAE
jgi:uncharacterized repeat protein (TIGR01451 family)